MSFKKTIVTSIHQVVFFVLPISVFLIVLRIPVVRLVFGASRFDWESTVLTSMTLSAFSLSIFAQAIAHILTRGFYALHDTKTPMLISVGTILLNSILSVVFITGLRLPVWSLGVSTTVSSIIHAILLTVMLFPRIGGISRQLFLYPAIKMTIASLICGIVIYIPLQLLDELVFDTTRVFGLILLTGLSAGLGFISYVFLSWVLGVSEVYSLLKGMERIKRMRAFLFEPSADVVDPTGQSKLS